MTYRIAIMNLMQTNILYKYQALELGQINIHTQTLYKVYHRIVFLQYL